MAAVPQPSNEDLSRLLADARAMSEKNAGAEEREAHSAMMRERARQSTRRSVRYDTVKWFFCLLLLVFLAVMAHHALNLG